MKKVMSVIILFLFSLVLCSFLYQDLTCKGKFLVGCENSDNLTENDNTITNDLSFVVNDRNSKQPIEGVRLVVINIDGDIIDILTTDSKGQVKRKISTNLDKRFYIPDSFEPMERGTVTVIAYKKGYCEVVLLDVPVYPFTSYQPFSMSQVISGQRNEPETYLGNIHHLDIGTLVDKYRKYLNLK